MKLFISYHSLLCILLSFACRQAAAQDKATTEFIDSLKMQPVIKQDTAITYDSTANYAADTAQEIPVDSTIAPHPRAVSAHSLSVLKKDKGFYYQSWLDSLLRADDGKIKVVKASPKIKMPDLSLFFSIFQIILWVLAAAILMFVVYKLFLSRSSLFVRNKKNIDAVIQLNDEPAPGDYESLVAKAEATDNYRLAVRYRYLQALKQLAEKNYIVTGTEKTNYQYISEVRKRSATAAKVFSAITLKYDYIWYGEYAVTGAMYTVLRHDFDELNKSITQQ